MGLGPTLPAAGPAATSTLGSEVGAKPSLPPLPPPLGRFCSLSTFLPAPKRLGLHRGSESILLDLGAFEKAMCPPPIYSSACVHKGFLGLLKEKDPHIWAQTQTLSSTCYVNLDKNYPVSELQLFLIL